MQMIGDLHIPVSLAPIKDSLMLTGTKGTFNSLTVQIFLLLLASRRRSSSQQLATSMTSQNNILQFFLPKFTALCAASLTGFMILYFAAEQCENLKFQND
jgi:hypothetical protein